ncbi:hypothetical protein GPECTOR_34g693 [Gonium pectorale]|uniref:Methyltransferase type 11 domain-containing protein n=1 Tax=Gonium pectorale TaxID=33097 RepID=A0A150GCG5_GONPE|nr:hypothetical protein GPECTOR_34g693 [Gonium pectorale]|eukprot:KXZ47534.1 hypothetical protein GPECTOR_34g693 [Gonium pectorale]
MAADGFVVTNVDISPVVIEQMKSQHADNRSLEYLVADCRDMSQLVDGTFHSCIDKGTLDAVLCSPAGQRDAAKYLQEIARLLRPGGTFLLISLGSPDARLALLEQQQLWDDVQVLLLPKPLLYLQSDSLATGRPLPARAAANKDQPIEPLGPWPASEAAARLLASQIDLHHYFFAYIAVKPASATSSPPLPGSPLVDASLSEELPPEKGFEAGKAQREQQHEGVGAPGQEEIAQQAAGEEVRGEDEGARERNGGGLPQAMGCVPAAPSPAEEA